MHSKLQQFMINGFFSVFMRTDRHTDTHTETPLK